MSTGRIVFDWRARSPDRPVAREIYRQADEEPLDERATATSLSQGLLAALAG